MLILVLRLGIAFLQEVFRWEWLYYIGTFLAILFLISLCDELNDRFKRIPFGPMRLPLFGNRVQLWALGRGNRPYAAITRMAGGKANKAPSGFMKVFFGLTGYISVNGARKVQEVLEGGDEEWAGERDEVWRLDRTEEDKEKKAASGGQAAMTVWVSRRNIAIRCLKEIAMCRKDTLNGLISKQVHDLLTGIENQEKVDRLGQRDLTGDTLLPNAISTVWSVLTGNPDVEVTDKRVQTVHRCLNDWVEKSISLNEWIDYYPFMVRWFPGWTGWSKLQEVNHDFRKVLKSLIKEQYKKAALQQQQQQPRLTSGNESFVQACIREFKELRQKSFATQQMNDSSSIALLFEFLCPGPLIVSSQVSFCLSFIARDPAAQEKIFQEINKVTAGSPSTIPTWDLHEKMPFTTAFLLESLRLGCVIPLERRKLLKLERKGETRFPKEMPLLLNYHSANVDPSVWPDPLQFNAERFLSPKGQLVNQEKLVSLSAEKHLCAGQALLRMITFSFLTGMLKKWQVDINPNWNNKGGEGAVYNGLVNKPAPFRVTLKQRGV